MSSTGNLSNIIYALTVYVLCDTMPPKSVEPDFGYLFEQTISNQKSVLNAGFLLWKAKKIKIGVLKHKEIPNFAGFETWRRELCSRGVRKGDIIAINSSENSINTLNEAQALVRFAKDRRLGSIYITAVPFHQLRAFMTTISVAKKEFPKLRVYNAVGSRLNWSKYGVHSGGVLEGRRYEFLESEWERIGRYHKEGDLVSLAEAVAYLKKRDGN